MTIKQAQPTLYLSLPHACSYLPDRKATTLFVDPSYAVNSYLYQELLRIGFRRSGGLIYRPHCESCSACMPVRVPVNQFKPSRSQKRILKKNRELVVYPGEPDLKAEHFDLYRRYQHHRHPGSSMDNADPEKYIDFLVNQHLQTIFYEFRLEQRLLAVAVTDRLPESLSAVYTFFDPEESHRSLGGYAILWQIQEARRLNLESLYLGYWIEECQKMAYKADYRPLEAFAEDKWSILAMPDK